MTDFVRYGLLGLGPGAIWALSALGLLIVYRGAGVLNFAHGATGLLGAMIAWQLDIESGWSYAPACAVAVATAALTGAAIHLLVMRPLRHASSLARLVATLAATVLVTSTALLVWGPDPRFARSPFPARVWHLGSIQVYADRILLLAIGCGLALCLWLVYRYSRFGLATSAVAESRRSAATLGHSPDAVATVNWALGSALAATAAILVSPIASLSPTGGATLQLTPLAAALVGGFRSFPITVAAGIAIGIAQGELAHYNQPPTDVPGLAEAFPFFVILGTLLLRGRVLPLRDAFLERPPRIGTGRIRLRLLLPLVIGAVLLAGWVLPVTWTDAMISWSGAAVLLLSLVVVTGYAGQVSLVQTALAGGGVLVALRLASQAGLPLWASVPLAVTVMTIAGAAVCLPAVRTRGANLAVLTLGLGIAIETMAYPSSLLTGGPYAPRYDGTPDLFGWDIDAVTHSNRYAGVCIVVLAAVTVAVANLRRGRAGRRLLSLRANERAAAALGISIVGGKVYAFALGAAIASLAGILLAFRHPYPRPTDFPASGSPELVTLAMIGGIGYLVGPVIGAAFASGALVAQISGFARYLPLGTSAALLLLLVWSQDGVARQLYRRAPRRRQPRHPRIPAVTGAAVPKSRPTTLEVRGLTVRYGAVVALDDVTLTVRPAEVVGLIGPNGSGKSTLIDAVTGFVGTAAGTVSLDGRPLGRSAPAGRARLGLSRSFQSLELFDDLTVLENLQAAADPRDRRSYLRDLVAPTTPPLPPAVQAVIAHFALAPHLDRTAETLPYGERRKLAIARAIATRPSIVLLDEPAAGLSDDETRDLAHLIRALADDWGIGVLLVDHDIDLVVATADTVTVLDAGRVIAQGTPVSVRNDPAVVDAYLGHPDDVDDVAGETTDHPRTGSGHDPAR